MKLKKDSLISVALSLGKKTNKQTKNPVLLEYTHLRLNSGVCYWMKIGFVIFVLSLIYADFLFVYFDFTKE